MKLDTEWATTYSAVAAVDRAAKSAPFINEIIELVRTIAHADRASASAA